MSIKIWLDDIRPAPQDCYWAKTAKDAIFMIDTLEIDGISFDHDLGDSNGNTGYTVAQHIEKLAYLGEIQPIRYSIHSANPTGRRNIQLAMESAQRFWDLTE